MSCPEPSTPLDPATTSTLSFTVAAREAGQRLDHFLAARLATRDLTRSRLQALIRQGAVTLADELVGKPGTTVGPGDQVVLVLPAPEPVAVEAQQVDFTVLYEDGDILVLAKPPGLVVHPAAGHLYGTLVHGLLHHCRDLSGISGQLRPGIVHRLDKDTSGCLVVAKNDRAHQCLVRQFKDREVEKIYWALLRGTPGGESGRVDLPVGRHPVQRKKMAVLREGGREAVTHWRVLRRFSAGYTLVEVRLETGRTHQIRVHMASLHAPLAGDQLYGHKGGDDLRYAIKRQSLHALKLSFKHPADGHPLSFTAPLWADMENSLTLLAAGELE